MRYYGTRNTQQLYSLKEAAKQGLAPCKGVFMPESIPSADIYKVLELSKKSYADVATYIASLFFGDSLSYKKLNEICSEAYDFDIKLHNFNDKIYTLELFDGPTLAFKDFGARFMSRMLQELFPGEKIKILTATSGDTGSAVAAGFHKVDNIEVYILYPKGRVSDFQERQMTTHGDNIKAISVNGSFDDCQSMVKSVFAESEFCVEHSITSANSISLLRWIPQCFYYFYAYSLWIDKMGDKPFRIAVPSGNYGNITAGLMAKRMGLPIEYFIACTNSNDVIPRYLSTGEYMPKESIATISNAMDVGSPNNFERLLALCCNSLEGVRKEVKGYSCSDEKTKEIIKNVYKKYGYIIDPHSAIGYAAADEILQEGMFISTAHHVKFADVIEPLLGIETEYPQRVLHYMAAEKHNVNIDPDFNLLKDIILCVR